MKEVVDTMPGSEPYTGLRELASFLVVAFHADQPALGGSRHALRNVSSLTIGRGEKLSIGRSAQQGPHTLDLVLPTSRMSRQHARLLPEPHGWVLHDSSSRNGSFVNGQRVTECKLNHGDVIELGSSFFVYVERTAFRLIARDVSLSLHDFGPFSTLNPELEAEFQRIQHGASSKLPVLLLGETGTGKEICARAIHGLSRRAGAFVAINCGAIPQSLVEAQLFGFVKGAFTGADRNESGMVRAAERGTLLLDEIGDLPPSSQAALLRVLQNSEVAPVGSSQPLQVDVRVISATHRPLAELAEKGLFRADLLARLAGFQLELPALRDRREDLGLLIATILAHQGGMTLRPSTARVLFLHEWPHNIRELEQCLASSSVLARGKPIGIEHLPRHFQRRNSASGTLVAEPKTPLSEEDAELRARLIEALSATGGNLSEVARRMGKARQQIQRWLKRFDLDATSFTAPGDGE